METFIFENFQEKKAHTLPDFPFNVYPCSIPLDFYEVPLHWHDEFEIISIKKGRGLATINLTTYPISAGNLLIIRPGELHSLRHDHFQTMEYENILFQPNFLLSERMDLCSYDFFLPFLNVSNAIPNILSDNWYYHKDLEACIQELDELCSTQPFAWQIGVKACLFRFFYLLFTNIKLKTAVSSIDKSYETIKTILKYIELHYQEPISISEIATAVGYSESYFMRFFKTHMHVSFIQYVNDYRLTIAARHLAVSHLPVLEIAFLSGFDNLSYFNRLFRKKYKETPSEYRKAKTKGVHL